METTIVYWGHIRGMEKKMEATILKPLPSLLQFGNSLGQIQTFRVQGLRFMVAFTIVQNKSLSEVFMPCTGVTVMIVRHFKKTHSSATS